MHIHIVSLFGESITTYLDTSIMKRAQEKGLFRYTIYNLADWSIRNTRRVDATPYGGGAGTVISIAPLTYCIRDIIASHGNMPIFLMSPAGDLLDQSQAEKYSNISSTIIICGHYEGVDARIFELFDINEISIGNYVISSGELAAMVFIDSIVRLIPNVLSPESLQEESFSSSLLRKREYPQYSRPKDFEGISVPPELLSGDPHKINQWKHNNLR